MILGIIPDDPGNPNIIRDPLGTIGLEVPLVLPSGCLVDDRESSMSNEPLMIPAKSFSVAHLRASASQSRWQRRGTRSDCTRAPSTIPMQKEHVVLAHSQTLGSKSES